MVAAQGDANGTAREPTLRVQWLDHLGGGATSATPDQADGVAAAQSLARTSAGAQPIAWWRSANGREQVSMHDGAVVMRTAKGEWLEQPIAAYAPLVTTLEIRGRVSGTGTVVVRDGQGGRFARTVGADPGGAFVIPCAEIAKAIGRTPVPRLTLRLEPGPDGTTAQWSDVEAWCDLPCPSETSLRAEVLAHVDDIVTTWFERSVDDVGPRKTGFLAKWFDAVTGKTLAVGRSTGFNSFYQSMLEALEAEPGAKWRTAFERMLSDFLDLQLHPETGLPRNWDPVADVPDDTTPVEIALPFGFLIVVAEHGPDAARVRARAAAVKIGETVLRKGLTPDGNCAASYVPRDGTPNPDVSLLRRLDVPLQLVRLSKLTGDARYAAAVREPLATLELTNGWAGTWDAIDPGFDDDFGHYGARATRALLATEGDPWFRRFALEGWAHYEPIWRAALTYGGNVAADQVRCWKIGADLAHAEPKMRQRMGQLLHVAARSHFKGEQYDNGAWGDVTIYGFSPRTAGMQVGDLTGAPQNLLTGLASIYVDELGLRTGEIRGMYTAVLRSSVVQYGKKYGFIAERAEREGANPASGSLRMMTGLVEMLRALTPPK